MTNTTPRRFPLQFAAGLLCGALAIGAVAYGPLNPPGGAVTSTAKTLAEVEPRVAINATNTPGDADSVFKITQSGAYYLTGNLVGVASKHGIEITASDVSIDLMGFEVFGGGGTFDGVTATAAVTNISITNGSVRAWAGDGIDLGTATSANCSISRIRTAANAGFGIIAGSGSTVTDCQATSNGGSGFTSSGVTAYSGCTARFNTGSGFVGAAASTFANCTSITNTIHGFQLGASASLNGCSAQGNTQDGFNGGSAITLINCLGYQNTNDGIVVLNGSTVTNCVARLNGHHGIQAGSTCLILANACTSNGQAVGVTDGAGILVAGGDNRIEGNNCTGTDRGIEVNSAGNIIIRNTCAGNTQNWNIVANNVYGPMIDRTSPGSLAVTTNAAATAMGTTDAHVNISY